MVRPNRLDPSDSGNPEATVQWQEYLGETRVSLNWKGRVFNKYPAGTMEKGSFIPAMD